MGAIRTLPAVTAAETPTPIYTGTVVNALDFSIAANGLATVYLSGSSFPTNGYNPGQQVTLWGFATATYFNGKTVTVYQNNPNPYPVDAGSPPAAPCGSFSFWTTGVAGLPIAETVDDGFTASAPSNTYRAVRIEADQSNSTNKVYVGDGNVSSSQYIACLTLAGQLFVELAGNSSIQNIPANRIFVLGSASSDCLVHVTLIA